MQPNAAILSRYQEDGWRSRLLRGPQLQRVCDWIGSMETNPPVPANASGKPLAWLILLGAPRQPEQQPRVIRKIGLISEDFRTTVHTLTAKNMAELDTLFAEYGQPFSRGPKDTPPYL